MKRPASDPTGPRFGGARGLFAADGCAIPSIRLQLFRVVLVGRCEHVRALRISIDIRSVSPLDARRQATALVGPRSLYVWESTETII